MQQGRLWPPLLFLFSGRVPEPIGQALMRRILRCKLQLNQRDRFLNRP